MRKSHRQPKFSHGLNTPRLALTFESLEERRVMTVGMELVKDIASGTLDSQIRAVTQINDSLYFIANDGVHGIKLLVSAM